MIRLMFDPQGLRPFVRNWEDIAEAHPPLPVVPVEFEKDGLALSCFSTVTTLGTPQDAMLQEIRIESFFPADEPTPAHAWIPPKGI